MSTIPLSKLQIDVDTHTHTVLSVHAWSTLKENAEAAASRGMKKICVSEHGPALSGSHSAYTIPNAQVLPPSYCGVDLVRSGELDIMNPEGGIDVSHHNLKSLQFGIASLHRPAIEDGGVERNTAAYLAVLKDPVIDILGHPDRPAYPCDARTVVKAARDAGKLIEINNHSIEHYRDHTDTLELIRLCKEYGERVCVSSDAHFCGQVGAVDLAMAMLEELDFPRELIVNLRAADFEAYLAERTARIEAALAAGVDVYRKDFDIEPIYRYPRP